MEEIAGKVFKTLLIILSTFLIGIGKVFEKAVSLVIGLLMGMVGFYMWVINGGRRK